ncbi:ThiF family adenylyltransferase [Bacteroidales bacterium OttesenSCG-928-K03]|nr:ThiF family adenylyltransferase [Bacteroidales bacterium OttesenSCG-928-L14]MDL2240189.1 ThiF family adenylyltransferase [Bacteroidales bacterium OttesenSCG-928-K22]MDL2242456.1 ThiF family adenylyltransferase [Bacteroidales bacterium OttesenSCG-928-K03]
MEEKTSILNAFWRSCIDIQLIQEFNIKDDGFWGCIQMDASPKEHLIFDVKVPLSYPLSNDSISTRFYCQNDISCSHVNLDNSICFFTPKHNDFEERLKLEETLLKEWRDTYYINEMKDDRYEYLITDYSNNDVFFFTDIDYNFKKGEYGEFTFTIHNEIPIKPIPIRNFYIKTIGKVNCKWAEQIHSSTLNCIGLYYFMDEEPVSKCRWIAKNWDEIDTLVNQRFKKYLYDIKHDGTKDSLLCILIGYKISATEIHWQMIQITKNKIPVKGIKKAPGYYEYFFEKELISWSRTVNCSYNRYFGRGALPPEISDKKILIIGTGAIGSSLAKILVKGGLRDITLCDIDCVETGNICRSEYSISHIQSPKVLALMGTLSEISPFVNIYIIDPVNKRLDIEYREQTIERLKHYDLIFDCSSDSELAYVFNELEIKNTIINISISNKANDLVCAVGTDFAHEKAIIFENLETTENLHFYEGTGCWHPTFEASYYDINGMLNLAIQNIANKISSNIPLSTFVIKKQIKNNSINLETIDY